MSQIFKTRGVNGFSNNLKKLQNCYRQASLSKLNILNVFNVLRILLSTSLVEVVGRVPLVGTKIHVWMTEQLMN